MCLMVEQKKPFDGCKFCFCQKNRAATWSVSKCNYLCGLKNNGYDSVAQLVEQLTLNQWVEGSSPSGVTFIIEDIINSNNIINT